MNKKVLTKTEIMSFLKQNKNKLDRYTVKRIGLFGSYARDEQKKNSDIDLVVEFKKPTLDNFMDLSSFLESSFEKKVDILTPVGIKSIRIKNVAENIAAGVIYV